MTDSGQAELAIEIKGLSKAYGRNPALRDLNLDVRWGEVVTVLGPNGSGKTTLIKVLATLIRPDQGAVRVAGGDIARLGQRTRRIIGVVTHEPLLYAELTGRENLLFVSRMFGLDRSDDRIASVARQMGVVAVLDQRVGTLSHGLRKRLAIARALLHNPHVLLMDEPESGLDQEALAMLDAIIADSQRPPRTVVMTTHNLERGLALGHRMVILARGAIAFEEAVSPSSDATALRDAYFRHTGATP